MPRPVVSSSRSKQDYLWLQGDIFRSQQTSNQRNNNNVNNANSGNERGSSARRSLSPHNRGGLAAPTLASGRRQAGRRTPPETEGTVSHILGRVDRFHLTDQDKRTRQQLQVGADSRASRAIAVPVTRFRLVRS